MNIPLPDSRKLQGLLITLCALLVLLIIAVIAIAIFDVDGSLFQTIGGFIASLGGAHQGAQALADRSPSYAGNQLAQAPPPPEPKPASQSGPKLTGLG